MEGKEVCYMHGGKSPGAPKGNKQTIKHGFYSDALTIEECQEYESILAKPLNLDEHIALLEVKLKRYSKAQLPGWSFDDWRTEVQQEFNAKQDIGDEKDVKVRVKKTTHKPIGADLLCKMLDVLTRMYWRRHQMFMDGQGDDDADAVKFVKSPFPMPNKPGKRIDDKGLDNEKDD